MNAKPFFGTRDSILVLAILGGGLSACVDDKYDLDKDIDMTVNVGGDYLSLPGGNSDSILLSKMIEIEEGDMMQIDENHEYHLMQDENISGSTFNVNTVTFNSSAVDFTPFVNDQTSYSEEKNILTEANDISEEIIEIGKIYTEQKVYFTLSLSTDRSAHIDRLDIEIPSCIILNEQSLTEAGGTMKSNTITFSNIDLTAGNAWEKKILMSGYDLMEGNKGVKVPESRQISRTDPVKITVTNNSSSTATVTPKLTIDEMEVNSIYGQVDPEINIDPTNVTLNDMPDFLKDPATALDIDNPMFCIAVNNPANAPMLADINITSVKEGNPIASLTFNDIRIPANSNPANVIIARKEGEYQADVTVINDKLNDLIRTVPDEICININPQISQDQYYEIDVKDYVIDNSQCHIDVPFVFRNGLNIAYSDSISDLHEDLKDLDKVTFGKANLVLDITNTIPLQMEILPDNVEVINYNGQKMDNIQVKVTGTIAESNDGVSATENELTIELTSEVKGVLSEVENITFKITAVPGQAAGTPLKDTQWMKIDNMRLDVPGGIEIDLN